MTTPTLIYDANPVTGQLYLHVHEGPAAAWTEVELRDLESALKVQLERLRREHRSTIEVGSRTYLVESPSPNGSRQPTLLIRTPPAAGEARPGAPAEGWSDGLFAEAAKLAAKPAVPRLEGRSLLAAVEELQELTEENPSCLLPLLLGSYLSAAEQLYRPQDAQRAGVYGLALRGLQRLTPDSLRDGSPGWKLGPSACPGGDGVVPPPENWINRLLAWALGRGSGGADAPG